VLIRNDDCPDRNLDPGICFEILYLLLHFLQKQPKIRHENPRRRFELSECFVPVVVVIIFAALA